MMIIMIVIGGGKTTTMAVYGPYRGHPEVSPIIIKNIA